MLPLSSFAWCLLSEVCLKCVRCYLTAGAVLDGNSQAARLLSRIVHQDIELCIDGQPEVDHLGSVTLSEESVGIWIDPIGEWDSAVCVLFVSRMLYSRCQPQTPTPCGPVRTFEKRMAMHCSL